MSLVSVFFFNDTATTEIYTLSLHDALPICRPARGRPRPTPASRSGDPSRRPGGSRPPPAPGGGRRRRTAARRPTPDRKSTRLNSSHANISYAVFCLKKKKHKTTNPVLRPAV